MPIVPILCQSKKNQISKSILQILNFCPKKNIQMRIPQEPKEINAGSMVVVFSIISQLASSWKPNASSRKPKSVLKSKRCFKIYSIIRGLYRGGKNPEFCLFTTIGPYIDQSPFHFQWGPYWRKRKEKIVKVVLVN